MSLAVQVRHRFGAFTLDATFEAPPGVTVLYGRSGCGKSSLINAVAGLFRPEAAQITVAGTPLVDTAQRLWLPPHRRRLGVIFQDARLFPHLTVRQNLLYGRWFAPRQAPAATLERVVEMLDLAALLSRRPRHLSGGERQRVAIGRALLAQPRLILADEPLASLDEARKREILPYFERLRDEAKVPLLYVSHAPTEVARLASTVVAMEAGRVIAVGTVASVLGDPALIPAGARAAGALLEAVIVRHHGDGLTEVAAGAVRLFLPQVNQPLGTPLRLRVPAQDVLLSRQKPEGLSALNQIPGTVSALRQGSGPGCLVAVQTPAGQVLARISRRSAQALDLAPGAAVWAITKTLAVAPEDVGSRLPDC